MHECRYRVITGTPDSIHEVCEKMLQEGFEPLGHPDTIHHDGHATTMIQALVRLPPKPIETALPTLDLWMNQVTRIISNMNSVPPADRQLLSDLYETFHATLT